MTRTDIAQHSTRGVLLAAPLLLVAGLAIGYMLVSGMESLRQDAAVPMGETPDEALATFAGNPEMMDGLGVRTVLAGTHPNVELGDGGGRLHVVNATGTDGLGRLLFARTIPVRDGWSVSESYSICIDREDSRPILVPSPVGSEVGLSYHDAAMPLPGDLVDGQPIEVASRGEQFVALVGLPPADDPDEARVFRRAEDHEWVFDRRPRCAGGHDDHDH